MTNDNSILAPKDYGTIKLKLDEVLARRGIKRNFLARKINTRFEVVDKWCSGSLEKMDLDILARICYVLDCRVEEIMEYVE